MSAVLKPQRARLTPMSAPQIEDVVRIENDIYEFPWTAGNFSDSISAGYHCWVAQEANVIFGYAVVMIGAGEAHLLNLSVARGAQGRGMGRALLAEVMAAALACGAHNMLLEVRPTNRIGRALYARSGFVQLGVRKAYYPAKGGREDALVLGCALGGTTA